MKTNRYRIRISYIAGILGMASSRHHSQRRRRCCRRRCRRIVGIHFVFDLCVCVCACMRLFATAKMLRRNMRMEEKSRPPCWTYDTYLQRHHAIDARRRTSVVAHGIDLEAVGGS